MLQNTQFLAVKVRREFVRRYRRNKKYRVLGEYITRTAKRQWNAMCHS